MLGFLEIPCILDNDKTDSKENIFSFFIICKRNTTQKRWFLLLMIFFFGGGQGDGGSSRVGRHSKRECVRLCSCAAIPNSWRLFSKSSKSIWKCGFFYSAGSCQVSEEDLNYHMQYRFLLWLMKETQNNFSDITVLFLVITYPLLHKESISSVLCHCRMVCRLSNTVWG